MSDLTPDGDLTSNAKVAIRYFNTDQPPHISTQESSMLRTWAVACSDLRNARKLTQLLNRLEPDS